MNGPVTLLLRDQKAKGVLNTHSTYTSPLLERDKAVHGRDRDGQRNDRMPLEH